MASSSTDSPLDVTSTGDSFTMIGDTDLEAIGAHCQYDYCHQLDFLPFRCESCRHTYCLDHRTESAHECPNKGAWAAARRRAAAASTTSAPQKPTITTGKQCSHPQCKTFVHTHTAVGVHCQTCQRDYCLKHRLREDHDCAKLKPLGARAGNSGPTQAQKAAVALGKLKLWGKDKAASASASLPKPKPSSGAARAVAVAKLKKDAKGDARIPAEKRVYLNVQAEAATTKSKLPSGEFFYNQDWSIGRMLDEAAKGLQVENVNNRGGGEEKKLRVYHVEGGRLLEFGEKIGTGLQTGNTVVLLRGIGPAVPDLIQV